MNGPTRMKRKRDFRMDEPPRDADVPDHDYKVPWDDVIIRYGNNPSDIRGDEQGIGFGTWCMNNLLEIKKQNSKTFRNHIILVDVQPYLGSDVIYERKYFEINDELMTFMREYDMETERLVREKYEKGDKLSVLLLTWYSALRSRNDEFTKLSFTINEHDWDEISDIL